MPEDLDRLSLSACDIDLRGLKAHRRDGTTVALSAREAEVLRWLAANPGRVVDRETLYAEVWGYSEAVVSRALDAMMRRLRHKIERDPSDPDHLVTVHGEGYRFEPGAFAPAAPDLPEAEPPLVVAAVDLADDSVRGTPAAAVWLEGTRAGLAASGGRIWSEEGDEIVACFASAPRAVRWCLDRVDEGARLGARGAVVSSDGARARRILTALDGGQVALVQEVHEEVCAAVGIRSRAWRPLPPVRLRPDDPPEVLLVTGGDGPDLPPVEGEVPEPAARLVGRAEALARIEALLGEDRLVTIVGTGGAGKTRLALEVAGRWQRRGAAAWFCDLSATVAVDEALAVVARTLRAPSGADLGLVLRGRPDDLVVLDNVEQVIDGLRALLARWAQGSGARLLVTSRERAAVAGERVFELMPLPVADGEALFAERVEAIGGAVGEPGAVRALIEALDGLPLAIELAAARSELLSPAELLARLDASPVSAVLGADRTRTDRHVDLARLVRWSWDLLAPAERRVLSLCSAVFVGRFGIDDAEAVLGPEGVLDALQGLKRRGLLLQRPDGLRPYVPVRDFAAPLADPSEVETARDRHARWFARRGEQALSGALLGSERDALLAALARELPELRAAFRRALRRDPDTAAGAFFGAAPALRAYGPIDEIEAMATALVEQQPDAALRVRIHTQRIPVASSSVRLLAIGAALAEIDTVETLIPRAEIALRLARSEEAERLLDRWSEVVPEGDASAVELARYRLQRAELAELRGRWTEVEGWLSRVLAAARARGARDVVEIVSRRLSIAARETGRLDEAFAWARASLAATEGLSEPIPRVLALGNLMILHYRRGEIEAAAEAGEEAAEALRRMGDLRALQHTLSNLGVLYGGHIDTERARAHCEEALVLGESLGLPDRSRGEVRLNLAALDVARGDALPALRWLDEAIGLLGGADAEAERAEALAVRGEARSLCGDLDGAEVDLDEAVGSAQRLGLSRVLGVARALRAVVRARRGDRAGAEADLVAADAAIAGVGAVDELWVTLLDAAAASAAGDARRAGSLVAEVAAGLASAKAGPHSALGVRLERLQRELDGGAALP